jgi:integrase/recombinase XerD
MLIRAAPSKRDRVLLEVAYAGGLRVSELVALAWADVLPRDEGLVQLSVTGKGGKGRQVLLPEIVSRSLLSLRGDAGANDPVFASRQGGGRLTERAVNKMMKRAAKAAGINEAVSPHWLRHAHGSQRAAPRPGSVSSMTMSSRRLTDHGLARLVKSSVKELVEQRGRRGRRSR